MSDDVSRFALLWNKEVSPIRSENCLGYDFRDSGQSLEPEPPASKTGVIIILFNYLNILEFFLLFMCLGFLLIIPNGGRS